MHIVMLLSNPYRPDPRVQREARALVAAGHRVSVICWDRQAELPPRQHEDGVDVIRVHTILSTYGSGPRQVFYLPRFWQAAVKTALEIQPDAVHCHDLDTLYAGWQLKRSLAVPLVYDAHEDYPALMSLYLPAPLTWLLAAFEKFLIRQADATITASSVLAQRFLSQGVAPVTTLGNFQPLEPFDRIQPADLAAARQSLGLLPEQYVVGYIGGFTRNRLLLPLIQAAATLPHVTVLVWGDGHQKAVVEEAAHSLPNLHYLGWLPPADVPLYTCMTDVIYYCIRPDYPGAIYNAPNTLANAMAAGRPIIANQVGDLGQIVAETGCGILLDEVTPQYVAAAVRQLEDPHRRASLGQAGWLAARQQYNAAATSRLLITLYQDLFH